MSTPPAALVLDAVSLAAPHSADKLLLQDISLSIAAGEQVAIIGRSGAGKTMLMQTLAASLAPQQGSLHLFGQQPWRLSAKQRQQLRRQLFLAP
ncbi:MAG: ATP-binding cassette domain-containing protein, partial [Burkholderiales bacterium]|nr:ATP-binding cassette domain-containing protein [Burkholderiales bacterium]